MSRGGASRGVVAVATAAVLVGCGDPEDASLCTAFAEYVDAREAVASVDPSAETADAAIAVVDDFLDRVQRLEQVADDRYERELDALETSVREVRLTLESVQPDADFDTWAPLIEDDFEAAADAAARVEDAIGPSCAPTVSAASET